MGYGVGKRLKMKKLWCWKKWLKMSYSKFLYGFFFIFCLKKKPMVVEKCFGTYGVLQKVFNPFFLLIFNLKKINLSYLKMWQ
jgi:hypothetical protein